MTTVDSERGRAGTSESREHDVSFFELLTPLIRRWRLIAGIAVGGALLAALILLLQRPVYTGQTSFAPETSPTSSLAGSLAGLAGLAGQFGGVSQSPSSSVSPDFFAQVLHSREIQRSTLLSEFPDRSGASRPLLDILGVTGTTPEQRLQNGTRQLAQQLEVDVDRRTGVVSLAVEMPDARLAADVANRMVELLNRFNLERRQSQSREERRFSGDRLATAERELRTAEQAHLAFLQRNRGYSDSPLLNFESNRLSREVQLKQEIFLTLTKNHEQARISEVRDTPVLTVVDSAVAPIQRTRPRRTLGTIIAGVLAGLVGVVVAYGIEFRRRAQAQARPDYRAMQEAWKEARQGVAATLKRS